jgi:hypothetical protein
MGCIIMIQPRMPNSGKATTGDDTLDSKRAAAGKEA